MPTPRPLPDIPGVYYCRIQGSFEGRPTGNVFTFQQSPPAATGAADIATSATVAGALEGAWITFASGLMLTGYTASEIQVYPLHTPSAPAFVQASSATGGESLSPAPIVVSGLVRHAVTRRGRGSQSRSAFSPIAAVSIEADGITRGPTYVTALTAGFADLISTTLALCTSTAGGAWSYVQLAKGTALHPTPGTFPITSSAAEPLVSTMRRRTRRNG